MYDIAGNRTAWWMKPARPATGRRSSGSSPSIGKGAPTKAGTAKVHGEPLGPEEAAAAKKAIGVPDGCQFYVFPEAARVLHGIKAAGAGNPATTSGTRVSTAWKAENPELAREWDRYFSPAAHWTSTAVALPDVQAGGEPRHPRRPAARC